MFISSTTRRISGPRGPSSSRRTPSGSSPTPGPRSSWKAMPTSAGRTSTTWPWASVGQRLPGTIWSPWESRPLGSRSSPTGRSGRRARRAARTAGYEIAAPTSSRSNRVATSGSDLPQSYRGQRRVRLARTLSPLRPALVLLGGCAETAPPALQQDLAQLKRDVAAITVGLARAKTDTETTLGQMDRRAQERLSEIQRNLAELKSRTDSIGGDLGRVEGRIDELRHRGGGRARTL